MSWPKGMTAEFRCECKTHYLVVEKLDEDSVWLGFYARYSASGPWKRIKDAWALMRGREVLVDDFVFENGTASRAGEAMEAAARASD